MSDGTSKPSPRNKELPRIRLSWDELEAVRANAKEANLTVSQWVRQMCVHGKVTGQTPVTDAQAVQQLLKVGNNLNQLVKSGHIHKEVDSDALQKVLSEVQAALMHIVPR